MTVAEQVHCQTCGGPTATAGAARVCVICGHEDGEQRGGGSDPPPALRLPRRERPPDTEPWWMRY